MNQEYFSKINRYNFIMMQVDKMLNSNLITEKEYAKIDTITADTCGLSSYSIYRENSLTNHEIGGNISHNTIGR